jgi:hypothetical protein
VQRAVRATGLASLDYPELKLALAAVTEARGPPFAVHIWLYLVATFPHPKTSAS